GHGGPAALTADDALQAQLTHQPFDRAAGHIDAPAPQRAGDPAGAIGAARLGMDLLDQGHELLVPQPAGRLRPLLAGVVSRLGPAGHPAYGPDPEAAVFQAVDHLVGLVRGRSSSWAKSALAALRISFARLNSATSLRSCFSSSRSTLVSRSSRSPLSASAWRTQPRRASLWMPRSFATCAIGRPVVRTSRTARSRSSSGYLRGAGTARGSPSGQDHKPGFRDSTKPGAAQMSHGHRSPQQALSRSPWAEYEAWKPSYSRPSLGRRPAVMCLEETVQVVSLLAASTEAAAADDAVTVRSRFPTPNALAAWERI